MIQMLFPRIQQAPCPDFGMVVKSLIVQPDWADAIADLGLLVVHCHIVDFLIWRLIYNYSFPLILQLTIAVYDKKIEHMRTYGNLTVQMQRNFNAPIFREDPYRRNLDWRDKPTKLVVQIQADDADGVSYFMERGSYVCIMVVRGGSLY